MKKFLKEFFIEFIICLLGCFVGTSRGKRPLCSPEQLRMYRNPEVAKKIHEARNSKEPVEFVFEGKIYTLKNM